MDLYGYGRLKVYILKVIYMMVSTPLLVLLLITMVVSSGSLKNVHFIIDVLILSEHIIFITENH